MSLQISPIFSPHRHLLSRFRVTVARLRQKQGFVREKDIPSLHRWEPTINITTRTVVRIMQEVFLRCFVLKKNEALKHPLQFAIQV